MGRFQRAAFVAGMASALVNGTAGAQVVVLADLSFGALAPLSTAELRLIDGEMPRYTLAAWRAKIEGIVLLEADVNPAGTVQTVRLLKGLPYDLGEQAVDAVRGWRFTPYTNDDSGASIHASLTFYYQLQPTPPTEPDSPEGLHSWLLRMTRQSEGMSQVCTGSLAAFRAIHSHFSDHPANLAVLQPLVSEEGGLLPWLARYRLDEVYDNTLDRFFDDVWAGAPRCVRCFAAMDGDRSASREASADELRLVGEALAAFHEVYDGRAIKGELRERSATVTMRTGADGDSRYRAYLERTDIGWRPLCREATTSFVCGVGFRSPLNTLGSDATKPPAARGGADRREHD